MHQPVKMLLHIVWHVISDQICPDPVQLSHPRHHRSVTQLLLDKITILSYAASPPLPPSHPPQPTMTPPWGSYNDCHAYHYWWGPSFPSGGPLIDLLTKDESVPSGGGGWPGRRWGEEPCVLLWVGIRPSRAFFTLIGTTPEPHTKSITSGAMGTQCGRARRNQ